MSRKSLPTEEPFSAESAAQLAEANRLEELLRAKIHKQPRSRAEELGRLLVSAIFYGALLNPEHWTAWLQALPKGTRDAPNMFWVEYDAGEEALPCRWFADPVSETLIRHWWKEGAKLPKTLGPRQAISAYLKAIGVCRPCELADRIESLAEMRWRLRMPVLLVECAAGRIPWRALPSDEWAQLICGEAAPQRKSSVAPAGRPRAASRPNREIRASPPRKPAIESCLRKGREWNGKKEVWLRKAQGLQICVPFIRALVEEDHDSSYLEKLINRWVLFRVDRQLLLPGLPKGRVISPKWAARQVRLIMPVIESLEPLTGQDGSGLTSELLERTYRRHIRAENQTVRKRQDLLLAIESFQEFLETHRKDICVIFSEEEYEDVREGEANVSAHLISPDVYEAARARLDGSDRLSRMRRLYLMLGFRAGLRHFEAEALLASDIVRLNDHLELQIRPNRHYGLKTRAARRRIPLKCLLPAHERNELILWLQLRERESAGRADQVLLFSTKEHPLRRLSAKVLSDPVQELLRELTGNGKIVYHHLRHSFVTYALATLLLPSDAPATSPSHYIDDNSISAERRAKLVPMLLGVGSLGQSAVDGIGVMIGHRSNGTTLLWYSHMLDWSIGQYVCRSAAQPGFNAAQVSALTHVSEVSVLRRTISREANAHTPRMRRSRGRRRSEDVDHGSSFVDFFLADVRKGKPIATKHQLRTSPPRLPFVMATDNGAFTEDWRALAGVLAAIDRGVDLPEIHARFGASPDRCRKIAWAADRVAALETKRERARFTFCGSPDVPEKERATPPGIWLLHQDYKRPRANGSGSAIEANRRKQCADEAKRDVARMDRLWPRLLARLKKPELGWLMFQFLRGYSETEGCLGFRGIRDTSRYMRRLLDVGIEPAAISIRRHKAGIHHTLDTVRRAASATLREREIIEHVRTRCEGRGRYYVTVRRLGSDVPCPAFAYSLLLMATVTDAARNAPLRRSKDFLVNKQRLPPRDERC